MAPKLASNFIRHEAAIYPLMQVTPRNYNMLKRSKNYGGCKSRSCIRAEGKEAYVSTSADGRKRQQEVVKNV